LEAPPEARRQVHEQVRIKALARQWLLSGKEDGYLLSGRALADAEDYEGKDPEIAAFMSASRQNARNLRKARWHKFATVLLALVIVGTGSLWFPALIRFLAKLETRGQVAAITTDNVTNDVVPAQLAALRELAEKNVEPDADAFDDIIGRLMGRVKGRLDHRLDGLTLPHLVLTNQSLDFPLDFSGSVLKRPWMQRLKGKEPTAPVEADFTDAVIEDGRFVGANLTGASFNGCKLLSTFRGDYARTTFALASLARADFSGCFIDKVNFANADLQDTSFNNAHITRDTDFTNAKLTGASFLNATIEDPNFKNADLTNADFSESSIPLHIDSLETTWWLANWGKRTIDPLAYDRDLATRGDRYQASSVALDLKVQQARELVRQGREASMGDLVTALNDWAWLQAIYGVRLEDARKAAAEAIDLVKAKDPVISDTIGYIDLQLGRLRDAAIAYDFIKPGDVGVAPSARYRYALVLAGLGRCDEAQQFINGLRSDSGELIYSPTHERVLVPALSTDACPEVGKTLGRSH
jgi:uncharacterized protein YjbI with pentapeptide repeats